MLAMRKRSVGSAGSSPGGSVVDVVDVVVVLDVVVLDVVVDVVVLGRAFVDGRLDVGRMVVVVVVVVVEVLVVDDDVVVDDVVVDSGGGGELAGTVVGGGARTGTRTPYAASWSSSPWRATATEALKSPLPSRRRDNASSKAAQASGAGGGSVVVVVEVDGGVVSSVAAGTVSSGPSVDAGADGDDLASMLVALGGSGRVGSGADRSAAQPPTTTANVNSDATRRNRLDRARALTAT
jgi:hypothetical protein